MAAPCLISPTSATATNQYGFGPHLGREWRSACGGTSPTTHVLRQRLSQNERVGVTEALLNRGYQCDRSKPLRKQWQTFEKADVASRGVVNGHVDRLDRLSLPDPRTSIWGIPVARGSLPDGPQRSAMRLVTG